MQIELLKRVLEHERNPVGEEGASFSSDLPHNYAEIARAFLSCSCSSNNMINNDSDASIVSPEVESLIEDIQIVRLDKIRRNLHTLSEDHLRRNEELPLIDVTGIGSMEMRYIQPFITQVFKDHLSFVKKEDSVSSRTGGIRLGERGEDEKEEANISRTSNLRRFRTDE